MSQPRPKTDREHYLAASLTSKGRKGCDPRKNDGDDARRMRSGEWNYFLAGEEVGPAYESECAAIRTLDGWYTCSLDEDWPLTTQQAGVLRGVGQIPRGARVAVIGARSADSYGIEITQRIVKQVVRRGATLVSGGALGIDIAAHRAAMSLGAPTIAVIGAGLSEPAPRTHHPDFRRMTADGAVMSPFPCHQKAAPWTFLSRNPWIALMSDCVIVVQAGAKSGALHTGRFALSQDIPLWVVPGAFDNPLHRGCHQLISEGGRILTCEDEWAQGLALDFGTEKGPDHGGDTREPEFAASVWRSFDDRPRTMDELDARLAHSQSELSAAVVRLEVEGWLRRGPDGGFVRAWPGT